MDRNHPQHHLHVHQQHQQLQQHSTINVDVSDRSPQWSVQETKGFLMIREELDQTFMETKRNKQLWEVVSNRMKEKGYNRTAEQCKCKWKNLVTRYRGCETMDPEDMREQFPFYSELQTIFTARMQRMLWVEVEGGSRKKAAHLSSVEEEENESEGDKGMRRKKKKGKVVGGGASRGIKNNLRKILEEFMRQQMQIEAQWMEAFEARENERRLKELEWRQTMEAMEKERIMMVQRWRERDEQRRIREEARAKKRDALITALLNKLRRDEMKLAN